MQVAALVGVGELRMLTVTLEPYEVARAVQVGTERADIRDERGHDALYRQARKQAHSSHYMNNEFDTNINSALAELAVAKALNVYWHGHGGQLDSNQVFRWWKPDVGTFIEVKTVTDVTKGPRISISDYRNAVSWERRTQHRMWVVSAYVPTQQPDEPVQVWIQGGIDLQEAWEQQLPCCKHYSNRGSLRDVTRICVSHLKPRTRNTFDDIKEAASGV